MVTQREITDPLPKQSKTFFISYSRHDRAWVKDYLIRLLEAAHVDYVIDEKDLPIGGILEQTIREKIENSKYVVLVMTPDWVRGRWTHFESQLAPEKVWPIKLKDCDVPPHIGSRLYLDLCEARSRDQLIVKLLEDAGVSQAGIAEALNSVAIKTWALLVELLEEPAIADQVCKLQELFLDIQSSNSVLAANKQLHDHLQDIQLTLSQIPPIPDTADDVRTWKQVQRCVRGLRSKVAALINFAAAIDNPAVNTSFVDAFIDLPELLQEAAQVGDARGFASEFRELSTQVERNLPVMNDRIVGHVETWPVESLVDALQDLYESIADVEFDEPTSSALAQFRGGIDTLVELRGCILKMVEDHGTLQDADMDFQQLNRQGEPNLYDIKRIWKRVERWTGKLILSERYGKMLTALEQIRQHLQDQQTVRDDRYETMVVNDFNDLVDETNIAFHKLDIDLRDICNQLNPHGAELQKILDRMHQHEPQL